MQKNINTSVPSNITLKLNTLLYKDPRQYFGSPKPQRFLVLSKRNEASHPWDVPKNQMSRGVPGGWARLDLTDT